MGGVLTTKKKRNPNDSYSDVAHSIILYDEDKTDIEWDIYTEPCLSCGAQRWSRAKVDAEGKIILCDLCNIKSIAH